ncbi:hypothetical protein Aph01nite_53940 [Acrocarpospora phusangensis]|uniref:SIR2-like domain-containing protein n=1 Tax=Acrocarpospora phusangensis TaxID=1070424 RepID=A0A919QFV8_9ACTN|nr:SIR2 family protein [Acrocarpospora phusangensis]GIH27084.1 hypothetical protein Aph01nite_53940 [Acrocarpospora phusangensis]
MKELDWQRLVAGLESGDCTPFIGAGMCSGILPTGRELSAEWARRVRYPFEDKTALPEVMDFAAIHNGDAVFVKQEVLKRLAGCGTPDFDDPHEPHALLAKFPLAVYFTTNYDKFMSQALTKEKKQPKGVICPWYLSSADMAAHFGEPLRPTAGEPVVFHLHGSMDEPRSLVLSRSDYVSFLINLSKDYASDDRKLVPVSLRPWLTDRPLLFIGYSLQDWTFNVLFQGLRQTLSEVHLRRHVSVQLPPPDLPPHRRRQAQSYLTKYFDRWKISIYWGTVNDFCAELRLRMGWV